MHTAPEHKWLAVFITQVVCHLLEMSVGLSSHLYVQGGIATETRADWQGDGVALFKQAANKSIAVGHIPGHQALADDVQVGGTVIVVAPPQYAALIQELADLKLHLVAYLNSAAFATVEAVLFVVVKTVIARHIYALHNTVAAIFGESIAAHVPPAILRLGIVQQTFSAHIHHNLGTAFGHIIDNFDGRRALLPIEGEVVIISLEVVFFGVAIATTVTEAGD